MKICILSMQEIKNYGSFLQAYALKKTIESLGHQCSFIPVAKGIQLEGNKYNWLSCRIKVLNRFWGVDFYKRIRYACKFHKRFSKEFHPELGVNDIGTEYFEMAVIGSDEVFNCLQKSRWGFSLQLFGKDLPASQAITYAASFGATTLEGLKILGVDREIATQLKRLSAISVRDENSREIASALTGGNISLNVDPVLIYNYDKLKPESVPHRDFIAIYSYPDRFNDKHIIRQIKAFAKSRHLKLISIGHYFPWCDVTVTPHPFVVLAYLENADYVITDTFHGTLISMKYNRPFCTIVRQMNNNKLTSLLKQFGLEDRIWRDETNIETLLNEPIDYDTVNAKISEETTGAISYLTKEIQGAQSAITKKLSPTYTDENNAWSIILSKFR